MKKLLYLILFLFIGTQCTTDDSVENVKRPFEVSMKFQVDGVDKIVTAKFVYDNSQKRYVIDSDLIEEIKAVDETTKKDVYVYSLKSKGEESARYEIKRGYYGYSGETGCFYYGTLYVGDNGESIFVADKGIYAILNPPMCDYWIC